MHIYAGLLFQHGHIADPKLARSLAGMAPEPAAKARRNDPAAAAAQSAARVHKPGSYAADEPSRAPHAAASPT